MTQPQPERFQFASSDGLSIACVKWSGDYPVRGVVQIAHDFYPGGRHEMLHELNRRDVFTNLLVWISGILERAS